jgi:hypothetical protein
MIGSQANRENEEIHMGRGEKPSDYKDVSNNKSEKK